MRLVLTDYKKIREELYEKHSKTFEKLHMSEKNDEITALRAENERLRTNAVKMLDEVDREYNRKTNAMIERHAATVARLTAEVERLKEQCESPFMDGYETAKEEYRPRLIALEAENERLLAALERLSNELRQFGYEESTLAALSQERT